MTIASYKSILQLLSLHNINVSSSYFKNKFLSHPHYPSILSVTDTLDELGIQNIVVKVEQEHFAKLPCPFVAHLDRNGGEFILVRNYMELTNTIPDFFEKWDGVILGVEGSKNWKHKENEKQIAEDKKKQKNQLLIALISLCPSIFAIFFDFSWIGFTLLFIALLGLFISWLVVGNELGIENEISDQICGRKSECESINKEQKISLLGGIGFGDAGIIWFSSLLFSIGISSLSRTQSDIQNVLTLFAATMLPFILFSAYYQWKVKQKWCRFCILVQALLLMQFIALIPNLSQGLFTLPKINALLLVFFVLLTVGLAWKTIKQLIIQNKKNEHDKYRALRFYYHEEIFMHLLKQGREVNTKPWEYELQLGNKDSRLQLVICCSPYCPPCANAHRLLHELLEKFDFGLSVRFAFDASDRESKKTKTVSYILQVIAESTDRSPLYKRTVFDDWFTMLDLDQFKKKYKLLTNIESDEQLVIHDQWSDESNIKFTPTIFINDHEMPAQYGVDTIRYLISGLIRQLEPIEEIKKAA